MRVPGLVIVAVALGSLAGCGEQGSPEADREQSGIDGRVHLGPQCPVEQEDHPCPDEPPQGSTVSILRHVSENSESVGDVIARTKTDADGSFRLTVAPGSYVVTADAGMSCELVDVEVTASAHSRVDVACDTGIR